MTLEQQLDHLLDFIIKNEGIQYDRLLYQTKGKIKSLTCYNKLKKDGYIFQDKGSFSIRTTASGKLFHEKGGYTSISEYSQRILYTAISTKKLGWITLAVAAISLILTIIFKLTEK